MRVGILDPGYSRGVLAAGLKLLESMFRLSRTKADLYHALSPVGGAMAVLMRKAPLAVTVHDMIPFNLCGYDYAWKSRLVRQCIRLSVKRCDAVIVPYSATGAELVSRLGVPADKIYVAHYGVDHEAYFPRPDEKRLGFTVLYAGEVSRSKGVDALLRAFALVKKRVAAAKLIIAGKRSKDQPFLEGMAEDMGLRDVVFPGYIPEDELSRYYSSAAVMVFPSRCGFGLSMLEAMACGTPVIAGAVLDAPEFVGDAGILVNPDDIEAIAESIIRVLTDAGLSAELSAKALEKSKACSWEKTAEETAEIYASVLRRKTQFIPSQQQ